MHVLNEMLIADMFEQRRFGIYESYSLAISENIKIKDDSGTLIQ